MSTHEINIFEIETRARKLRAEWLRSLLSKKQR